MKHPHFEKIDCIDWMESQEENSIDCVITSPPYNLDIKYAEYKDNLSRDKYLEWLGQVSKSIKKVFDCKKISI